MTRYSIQVTHRDPIDGTVRRRYVVDIDADSQMDAYLEAWDRDPGANRFEALTADDENCRECVTGVCPGHPEPETTR